MLAVRDGERRVLFATDADFSSIEQVQVSFIQNGIGNDKQER